MCWTLVVTHRIYTCGFNITHLIGIGWILCLTSRTFVRINFYRCTKYFNAHTTKEQLMPKKDLPAISPAETEILRLVWQLGRATVQQVTDALPHNRHITYATVQTLLRRLEKKGYLKHQCKSRAHVFSAAIEKEAVIKRSVMDFVDRLFAGDPIPLVHHLAKHGRLSTKDINRLKKLIDAD